MSLSILLLIIGATMECQKPEIPPKTENEIGAHPEARWQLVISYREFGLMDKTIYTFIGTASEADSMLKDKTEKWNKEHPKNKAIESRKILCWIPRSHGKKVGARHELSEATGF